MKASSGTRKMGRFHDWTWDCRDCCNFHGLGSQRVAREEKYQVLCSLSGVVSCKGAATSLVPRVCLSSSSSSSVSVFVCLRLRHSGVSSAMRESSFVFVRLRLRPSPCSSISVFVCLRRSARWLVQRASAICPLFYFEGLDTTVACAS